MQLIQIPLAQLCFGHEFPGADINSRVTGRDDEVTQMLQSIASEGLLQPLLVCSAPESDEAPFYTIDGNRRLAALKALHADDDMPEDEIFIPAMLYDGELSPRDALRKSLVANDLRLPLHPVDRHETFVRCFDAGDSVTDIAIKYGTDERTVKQSLAIGKLAPEIRADWRSGKLTAETAKSFTLIDDHEKQVALYKSLSKRNGFDAEVVRDEIGAMDRNVAPGLAFVGREAFEAAGGRMVDDLFGYVDMFGGGRDIFTPVVTDPQLLDKLVSEKLAAKCADLIDAGWSWAAVAKELPSMWEWSWERLKGVTAKKASSEQRAKSGCVLKLTNDGQLDITYGVVKPNSAAAKEEKAKKKAEAKANGEPTAEVSQVLRDTMVEQLTHAAADSLTTNVEVALAVLIAGFMASSGPCKASINGLKGNWVDLEHSFLANLKRAIALPLDKKLECLCAAASYSLDFRGAGNDGVSAVCAAIPKDAFQAAIFNHFDIEGYFNRAPKDIAIAALKETFGKDAADGLDLKKKGEVAAYATDKLRAVGWLPSELRTVHYEEPRTDKPKAKPVKKAKKPSAKSAKKKARK